MSSFQLNIQELRDSSNVFVLTVRWFTSIKDIKDMIHRITRQPPRCLDLFYGTNARVLSNNMTLHDFGIERTGHTLRLAINSQNNMSNSSGMKASYVLSPSRDSGMDSACRRMLQDVTTGLQNGLAPSRTDVLDCTGGVYFMKNIEKRKIAVFKPHDEEQGMPNNDKGYGGNGEHSLRPNFKPGQGCIREVAAYIMDVNNFTGVPPTTLVHCEHPNFNYSSHRSHGRSVSQFPKLGSLQTFVNAEGTFEDYGDNMFSDFEVQKLALFDIRTLNCDRNASNILLQRKRRVRSGSIDDGATGDLNSNNAYGAARKGSRSASLSSWENGYDYSSEDIFESSRSDDEGDDGVSGSTSRSNSFVAETERRAQSSRLRGQPKDRYLLVPIDHGYCCPSALDIKEWDWAWFHLPHLKRPVHPKIKDYLSSIDLDKMCKDLEQRVSMSEESLFLIRLTHKLLVSGVEAGLTLYDIAGLIARLDEDEPSPLERAIAVGEENALRAIEMRSGRLNSRGAPSLRLESGGRGVGIRGAPRTPTSSGPKERASDENLPSSAHTSAATSREDDGVLPTDCDRDTSDLFLSMPLVKHGSSSSMGSNGSTGFGIGYVEDESDAGSDMDTSDTFAEVGMQEEKGTKGSSGDLSATFAEDCAVSGSGGALRPPLPLPWSPSTPTSGVVSPTSASKQSAASAGTASYGLGVGISERTNGLAGAPLSRMQTLQTPPMSTFKAWQTSAHLSPTASMKVKKGDEMLSQTPPPISVSLAQDSHSRPRFTQSGRDWLRSQSNQESPPSGITLQFDKLATDDDEAGSKALTPISDPSKSAFPSPTTDVGSSGTFDIAEGATSTSSDNKSPRNRKRGSPTAKHHRKLKTTSTEDMAAASARAAEADVDTDVEGSSPNDSNEEGEGTREDKRHDQKQQQPSRPPRTPSKATSPQKDADLSLSMKKGTELMRVTSFSAFSNAPLYDTEDSERRYGRLNREKRRFQVSTTEFKTLREHFTNDRVSILIGKVRSGSGSMIE